MWPNGKKLAVSVTVMFETWADDKAPTYSVQTTQRNSGPVAHAGKACSTYGGRVGVWRIINLLDRLGIPGTFFVNARCTEQYPDAVKQIVRSGHDIGGHAYTQDQLLAYMSLEDQEATIRQSIDLLQQCGGKKVTGWASPVVAFTPETAGFLAKAGLTWTTDITYVDLPIKIHTPHGTIAGVPTTDFSDNRVLRANPRDLYDTYKGTFDYLVQNEPMGLIVMVIHCQFGGRPLISAVLNELLSEVARSPDVWFARHEELAQWALAADVDEHSYQSRFFDPAGQPAAARARA
jgi:peptidoglycan/xylan/chitin deacetylase (PgdA/CDA1 family)